VSQNNWLPSNFALKLTALELGALAAAIQKLRPGFMVMAPCLDCGDAALLVEACRECGGTGRREVGVMDRIAEKLNELAKEVT
jgi:hypothetical protein